MLAQCIEADRNAQHSGTRDEDPIQHKCRAEDVAADFSKQFRAHVVDAVDFWVVQLEHADDVVGPGRDASDEEQTDDAWCHTKMVEDDGDREHA